ncbi:hypothetical protein E3J20_08520 [Candidatus Bathyarchaeota archaeon]|nr:MAG: hypothetical protein E3J20_08520 [Candidatus Bathyarchaeota archaeon]
MVEAVGWDMYDPRLSIKATVAALGAQTAAAFTIDIGDCCYIDGNGEIQVSETTEDKCHGCALMAATGGDELVLITHGRLKMVTAQTPGSDVKSPHAGADVGQPPDDGGGGQVVGFAVEEYLIVVNISATSTA